MMDWIGMDEWMDGLDLPQNTTTPNRAQLAVLIIASVAMLVIALGIPSIRNPNLPK